MELNIGNGAMDISWERNQGFLMWVCGAYVENLLVSLSRGVLLYYASPQEHRRLKQRNVLEPMVIVKT
jgi:hypothetical protein